MSSGEIVLVSVEAAQAIGIPRDMATESCIVVCSSEKLSVVEFVETLSGWSSLDSSTATASEEYPLGDTGSEFVTDESFNRTSWVPWTLGFLHSFSWRAFLILNVDSFCSSNFSEEQQFSNGSVSHCSISPKFLQSSAMGEFLYNMDVFPADVELPFLMRWLVIKGFSRDSSVLTEAERGSTVTAIGPFPLPDDFLPLDLVDFGRWKDNYGNV